MNNIQTHLTDIIEGEMKILPSGKRALVGVAKKSIHFNLCYIDDYVKVIYENDERSFSPDRLLNSINGFTAGKAYTIIVED